MVKFVLTFVHSLRVTTTCFWGLFWGYIWFRLAVTMAALSGHEEKSMLVSQCLDFCQTLGTSFSYSVDTMGKGALAPQKKRKPNPSTQRQNARRREEFMTKKVNASTEKKLSSPGEPGHPLVACILCIVDYSWHSIQLYSAVRQRWLLVTQCILHSV